MQFSKPSYFIEKNFARVSPHPKAALAQAGAKKSNINMEHIITRLVATEKAVGTWSPLRGEWAPRHLVGSGHLATEQAVGTSPLSEEWALRLFRAQPGKLTKLLFEKDGCRRIYN